MHSNKANGIEKNIEQSDLKNQENHDYCNHVVSYTNIKQLPQWCRSETAALRCSVLGLASNYHDYKKKKYYY